MKNKKKLSTGKKVLIALACVIGVIFALLLAVTIYFEWILGRMYYDPNSMETLSSDQIQQALQPEGTIDPNATVIDGEDLELEEVDKIEIADGVVNILLIGQDRRPGEVRSRSDVAMLVTVNTNSNEVTISSFMRDMYVRIPGYLDNRINVPYLLGGAELLFDTIEQNFGIRPDKFVEVDFAAFHELVDVIGGIDMELTEAEAHHLNTSEDFYDFPEENWELKAGMNHLDGKQALAYSRIRIIDPTADFARTLRQRRVIEALILEAKDMNLIQLNDLLLRISDMITTDMTSREILSYARVLYPVLAEMKNINSVQIPADGTFYSAAVDGVGMVLVPDLKANSDLLAGYQK